MIVVRCTVCPLLIRVMGNVDEVQSLIGAHSEYWPNRYNCPVCGAPAVGHLELNLIQAELEQLRIKDLTAQEAFAAFNGLGLPTEQHCTKEIVEELLRERPVRRLVATNIEGSRRCYVHHLELWDGTKLYFGAGADGAVIYRISPPHSYAAHVSHEHRIS